ncbi:hypothetical protein T459_22644 [Capsicum annuum]|uniref:Exostosin GT47 domain-containing protein n=1 Tax=Capsicum annuum TaxID=4072 RepID=A0A2G2YQ45_CAPAN|nr:putative auxin-induced protein 5NG4-like [Capsicum annuum]PHT71859.1 hypothetical protein T459_22644 [Capsicum annuum]
MKNLEPMNRSSEAEILSTSVSPYHDWELFAADYEDCVSRCFYEQQILLLYKLIELDQSSNASGGADHFYVYCHSIGRDAASEHQELHHNSIQVTCSSRYFQRLYVAHKHIGLPQVWPRQHEQVLNPPDARYKLVFFAGRVQNSLARRDLL